MEDTVTNARWQKVTKEWKAGDKYDKDNEKFINNGENMTANGKKDVWYSMVSYSTVGCRRTGGGGGGGVDGPSLDRSYFSRLQPISFLFFNPSSSHVG